MQFVNVVKALITSAKHLQRLPFHDEDVDDGKVDEGPDQPSKKFKSTLLQRLVSAISSTALCEHANRLLSALNTEAATAGDKPNLFNCTDGRFPEVCLVILFCTLSVIVKVFKAKLKYSVFTVLLITFRD